MNKYTITEDIYFTNFLQSKQDITEETKIQYSAALTKFYKATKQELSTVISNCKNQQSKVIETISNTSYQEGTTIIEKSSVDFDVNTPDSYINIYINTFIHYCKETKVKTNTTSSYLVLVLAFLTFYGVKLPRLEKIKREPTEWNLLLKEDINFIMNDSTLAHQSLISDLKDTGMRISDALKRTIGDFMKATSEYHDYIDVGEFIDNAPQDMIATWEFIPQKTKRFNIKCVTFSSPETCNLILQNLRKIKNEFLPRINNQKSLNLKLTKDDALFASRNSYYKGFLSQHSVSDIFYKKNKKLRNHHIALIEEAINEGKLAEEDKEEEISKIPKFHAHGCRKFFISTISKNCSDLRLCALLEGHTPPIPTDPSYVKHDIQEVKDAYMAAIPDLSLENTDVKVYTSDVRRETEAKIKALEKENEALKAEKDKEVTALWDEINNIKQREDIWKELKGGKLNE